jgi:hypothetical protein
MNLYLTSQDWTEFRHSRQIAKIERIKIGMFSYLLATTVDPVKNELDKTVSNQILLTTTLHFVRPTYLKRLPLELNVFAATTDLNGKIKCGACLAKGVDLHVKDK